LEGLFLQGHFEAPLPQLAVAKIDLKDAKAKHFCLNQWVRAAHARHGNGGLN
jgi:hypothetical protein